LYAILQGKCHFKIIKEEREALTIMRLHRDQTPVLTIICPQDQTPVLTIICPKDQTPVLTMHKDQTPVLTVEEETVWDKEDCLRNSTYG